MIWVREGGGNSSDNLIALCPNCHSLHTYGHIPASAIRHWKGILHALNHAFNRDSMDLLLFLGQPGVKEIWFSGDGVLRFSSLIAAGFVAFTTPFTAHMMKAGGPAPASSHKLSLTEKGAALVDAWIAGDEAAYRAAVSSTKAESTAERDSK